MAHTGCISGQNVGLSSTKTYMERNASRVCLVKITWPGNLSFDLWVLIGTSTGPKFGGNQAQTEALQSAFEFVLSARLPRLWPREKWLPFGPIIFISQPSICDQEGSERETFPILCGSTHLFAWVYFAEGTRGGAEFFSLMVFLLALE